MVDTDEEGRPSGAQRQAEYFWRAVGLAVLARLVMAQISVSVARIHGDFSAIPTVIRNMWTAWDAHSYLELAARGYNPQHPYEVVFPPLYPLLVRGGVLLTGDGFWAATGVSFLCSVAAGYLLQHLAAMDEKPETVRLSVWLMTFFPTAYFLALPYPESAFLALAIGSFLAARHDRWGWAGVLGFMAALTRPYGSVLLVPLVCEGWLARVSWRRLLWLGLVPLGTAVYLYAIYQVTGDAMAYSHWLDTGWKQGVGYPGIGFVNLMGGVMSLSQRDQATTLVPGLIGLGLAVVLALSVRGLRLPYRLVCWLMVLPVLCSTWPISSPRYLLPIFPMFILLARARHDAAQAVLVLSAVLFTAFTVCLCGAVWAF